MQGLVERHGPRGRLDQIVGQGWVLLGYDADPTDALTAAQRRQFARLDGIPLRVSGPEGTADVLQRRFATVMQALHLTEPPALAAH